MTGGVVSETRHRQRPYPKHARAMTDARTRDGRPYLIMSKRNPSENTPRTYLSYGETRLPTPTSSLPNSLNGSRYGD